MSSSALVDECNQCLVFVVRVGWRNLKFRAAQMMFPRLLPYSVCAFLCFAGLLLVSCKQTANLSLIYQGGVAAAEGENYIALITNFGDSSLVEHVTLHSKGVASLASTGTFSYPQNLT
jgi:hypothetical protein